MLKLAVIGDPIAHSLSPDVHGAALHALGIAHSYEKVQVKKGELSQFLSYVKEKKLDGFNLTMPHKLDIIPYLAGMDASAKRFGSVNTVKVVDGSLYGFNTDAGGYVASLKDAGCFVENSRVLILGAGGVVRTLAQELAFQGAKEIRILNRTTAKAEEIAASIDGNLTVGSLEPDELCRSCEHCDILVQATPLGMHGVDSDFEDVSFLQHLPKSAMVTDLIYNPPKTKLLAAAEQQGLATMNGLGMLIYQALLADRIYTDTQFELKPIYKTVIEKLKKR